MTQTNGFNVNLTSHVYTARVGCTSSAGHNFGRTDEFPFELEIS
jgi:hypothetical protein